MKIKPRNQIHDNLFVLSDIYIYMNAVLLKALTYAANIYLSRKIQRQYRNRIERALFIEMEEGDEN